MSDVTHRKRGLGIWGFEKKQLVQFLRPNGKVEIQTWARPDDFVRYGRRALVGLRAADAKAASIERLYLSLSLSLSLSSCRKTFKLKKVNKSFVLELRSRKVFRDFGFPMSISHNRIKGMLQQYIYKCRYRQIQMQNTGENKYTGDSIVQVRKVLLTSDFGSSIRGERHNSYYADHTIRPHKRAAHPVMLEISVGRGLKNIITNSVLYGRNSTICLHGPMLTPN